MSTANVEGGEGAGPSTKKDGKKKGGQKGKQYTSRVKSTAIEKNEIENLQLRYKSVDGSAIESFKDMPLSKKTQQGLRENDYKVPTEVQRERFAFFIHLSKYGF